MDVIGNGAPAGRDPEPDLDLDATPGPVASPRRARRVLADVLSAESLAVAALAIGASVPAGSSWLTYLLFNGYGEIQPSPQAELRQRATVFAAAAALTLAPGVAALLRRGRPTWVRGVAGGAVILGVLLLAAAALFLWRSAGAPATFPTG